MSRFRPINREIDFLPPSVQDWLPEGHLARYVVEVVEGLDLSELERAYAGRGSAPYHPANLLSLLIYGYATSGRMADWLRAGAVLPSLPDDDLETLTVHLARHAREVELILKGKPVETESGAGPEATPEIQPKKVA